MTLHALIVSVRPSVCLSQPEGFHLIFFHTKIRGTSFFFEMCKTDEYVIGALQRQNRICILETTFTLFEEELEKLNCTLESF